MGQVVLRSRLGQIDAIAVPPTLDDLRPVESADLTLALARQDQEAEAIPLRHKDAEPRGEAA
jgi:hypothetical protein